MSPKAPDIQITIHRKSRSVRTGTGATRERRTLTSRWYGFQVDGGRVVRIDGPGLDGAERFGSADTMARARVLAAGIAKGSLTVEVIR